MTDQQPENNPKVSVFISSYNHARYLPACLDSILAQTYEDFEIVILDDGSSDDSHALLSRYQEQYPDKVRYFWHEQHANRGISISCNTALGKTRGNYLAWCGSDDVWEPEKLAQQVRYLDANPRVGMVYGQVVLIDASGKLLPGKFGLDITHEPDPVARLFEGNWVPASTATVRRECLDDVGVFDEGLVYSDWDLWIRVASTWAIGFQPIIQAKYRLHDKNVSAGIDQKKNLKANIAVLTALEEKSSAGAGLLGKARNRALIELWLASHYYHIGEDEAAGKSLQKAFVVDPSLCADSAFLKNWLNKLTTESLRSSAAYDVKADIALKVLASAFSKQIPINGSFRKHFTFLQLASQSILHYQQRDFQKARYYDFKSLAASPSDWLRYTSLRGILLETVTGVNTARRLRRIKRTLLGK